MSLSSLLWFSSSCEILLSSLALSCSFEASSSFAVSLDVWIQGCIIFHRSRNPSHTQFKSFPFPSYIPAYHTSLLFFFTFSLLFLSFFSFLIPSFFLSSKVLKSNPPPPSGRGEICNFIDPCLYCIYSLIQILLEASLFPFFLLQNRILGVKFFAGGFQALLQSSRGFLVLFIQLV